MILFLGPPCCGKGTQASFFKEYFNFEIFSVGEFLRKESKLMTPFAMKIKKSIDKGEVINYDDIFKNLDINIFKKKKLILDGFPRTMDQAIKFENLLKKNDLQIDYIIEFQISYASILYRMNERFVCIKCGLNINNKECCCENVISNKSQKRADDNILIFQKRFDEYKKFSFDIFNFYKNKTSYLKIDASENENMVFQKIKSIIVA